jgi:hypothetical protein
MSLEPKKKSKSDSMEEKVSSSAAPIVDALVEGLDRINAFIPAFPVCRVLFN